MLPKKNLRMAQSRKKKFFKDIMMSFSNRVLFQLPTIHYDLYTLNIKQFKLNKVKKYLILKTVLGID